MDTDPVARFAIYFKKTRWSRWRLMVNAGLNGKPADIGAYLEWLFENRASQFYAVQIRDAHRSTRGRLKGRHSGSPGKLDSL